MRNLPLRPVALSLLIGLASTGPAFAAGQITFVSQGGSYQEAQTKAILDPAAKLLGITVNQDSIPDAWPAIKAQGATGKPIWDVVDTPTSNCLRGGREGLLEKLDFSKLPNAAAMPEQYRTPYSVAYEFYSTVIGYNKKTLKKVPQSWADFWNVKTFPGTRALRNDPQTVLEAALLADGAFDRATGSLPVHTHGGLLSEGYLHGMKHVYEAVEQIRGDAGHRQVERHDVALVTGQLG